MITTGISRKHRTEILIREGGKLAAELANELRSQHDIRVLQKPSEGLVMIKLREDARNSVFYLGEVLVTEAKVQVESATGLGVVRGTNAELALDLAVLDAAWNAQLPICAGWDGRLQDVEKELTREAAIENGRRMATRVNFVSMQEEELT